jgi:hypothetical protein
MKPSSAGSLPNTRVSKHYTLCSDSNNNFAHCLTIVSLFIVNQLVSINFIATGLWTGRSEIRFPVGAGNCFRLQIVQTDAGFHPAFYSMGVGEVKRPGREATYLHLVLRIRMSGAVPPLQYVPSWRGQRKKFIYF